MAIFGGDMSLNFRDIQILTAMHMKSLKTAPDSSYGTNDELGKARLAVGSSEGKQVSTYLGT
jgi:hypothetical protein